MSKDEEELASLYERYGPALCRKAERLLGSRDEALDVVHSLFTDLIGKNLTRVNLPYLYRATTNRSLNRLRNVKRRRELLDQQSASEPVGTRITPTPLLRREIMDLLSVLDKKSQRVLVYRFVDEMTLDEIATLLGVSRRAVSKRLAKAKRVLGKQTEATDAHV